MLSDIDCRGSRLQQAHCHERNASVNGLALSVEYRAGNKHTALSERAVVNGLALSVEYRAGNKHTAMSEMRLRTVRQ